VSISKGGAVSGRKCVKFVVPEINRLRIVRLKRWARQHCNWAKQSQQNCDPDPDLHLRYPQRPIEDGEHLAIV